MRSDLPGFIALISLPNTSVKEQYSGKSDFDQSRAPIPPQRSWPFPSAMNCDIKAPGIRRRPNSTILCSPRPGTILRFRPPSLSLSEQTLMPPRLPLRVNIAAGLDGDSRPCTFAMNEGTIARLQCRGVDSFSSVELKSWLS